MRFYILVCLLSQSFNIDFVLNSSTERKLRTNGAANPDQIECLVHLSTEFRKKAHDAIFSMKDNVEDACATQFGAEAKQACHPLKTIDANLRNQFNAKMKKAKADRAAMMKSRHVSKLPVNMPCQASIVPEVKKWYDRIFLQTCRNMFDEQLKEKKELKAAEKPLAGRSDAEKAEDAKKKQLKQKAMEKNPNIQAKMAQKLGSNLISVCVKSIAYLRQKQAKQEQQVLRRRLLRVNLNN